MGKSSAPPAPDYTAAANATAAGNLETAKYTTAANRINQITPYGNLTYTSTPGNTFNQSGYDTAMKAYTDQLNAYNQAQAQSNQFGNYWDNSNNLQAPTAPNISDFTNANAPETWTATQTLTPAQQDILNKQSALNSGLLGTAQSGLNYANQVLSQPGVDLSKLTQLQSGVTPSNFASTYNVQNASGNVNNPNVQGQVNLAGQPNLTSQIDRSGEIQRGINASGLPGVQSSINASNLPSYGINPGETYSDAIMRRLKPQMEQAQESFDSKMANQGIAPGTKAYDNALREFQQGQNDQLTSAIVGGMQTGLAANQQQFGQNAQQAALANAANQQLFGQNQAQQQAINAAQGQLFGQNAQQAALQNAANQQAYNQALGLGQFYNQAAGQQFQQGLSAQQLANQAAAQNTGNAANLAALQNQAAQQQYNQALQNAQLANQVQQQQFQQQSYNQMQPINVINALRTGTQVASPNYVNSANMPNTGGADLLGAAQNQYNAQLGAYNAQNAASGNFLGGLMNLGGAYILK